MAKKPKGAKGANDPFQRDVTEIETSIIAWQARLFDLWKVVFKKVASKLKSTIKFVMKLVKEAAKIAAAAGKAAVDTVLRAGELIQTTLSRLPVLLKMTIRLGKKLLSLIQKGTDPKRLAGTLKRLVTRYINMIREIYSLIFGFLRELDVLAGALAIINTFKTVLKFVFSWIMEVVGAIAAVQKVSRLLRKVMKPLKVELREAIKTSKKAARLKPA